MYRIATVFSKHFCKRPPIERSMTRARRPRKLCVLASRLLAVRSIARSFTRNRKPRQPCVEAVRTRNRRRDSRIRRRAGAALTRRTEFVRQTVVPITHPCRQHRVRARSLSSRVRSAIQNHRRRKPARLRALNRPERNGSGSCVHFHTRFSLCVTLTAVGTLRLVLFYEQTA